MFVIRRNLGASAVLILLSAGVPPAVAKDRIIFTSNGPSTAQLFIANADGTGERKLFPAPAALGVRTTRHSRPTQETHKKWRTAPAPDA